ncbi:MULTISPECIES: adenosylmethionine decarboxylase [Prauserella salsuginis group]|uniref:S-adenosylmethionine decarboxylase proenzyme n=2 Tax=Prauserella salsuginis group TaxID=2893672 RepID=A0A839XQN8_9PSEU|nr:MULTISPECIES: adenosylmethionine decarboxylase [Prauserella salsuginis group]MBB3665007.1 S-adenosylmethionine decarboxylase [Prauserella sediminis]MCR3718478.1 S-adenosylmethionine decarboxylase [Prauserella flava]MCR3733048.1 S-adenosylmethionine decarboxylase [Prauserella salsuginis]
MPTDRSDVGAFSGTHVLAELDGVDPRLLDDEPFLRAALARTLTEAGATVCDVIAHRFQPQGVTVLAMLAESHASVHTYPEIGAAFVDVFTCGDRADPAHAVQLLGDALSSGPVTMSTVRRGHPARQTTMTGG